jgi:hypothetical protein
MTVTKHDPTPENIFEGEQEVAYSPHWIVHVELAKPISYGATHKQSWININVESPEDVKVTGEGTLHIMDIQSLKHHYFPLANVIHWTLRSIGVPMLDGRKMDDTHYTPYTVHPGGWVGYYADNGGNCLAFLSPDGVVMQLPTISKTDTTP